MVRSIQFANQLRNKTHGFDRQEKKVVTKRSADSLKRRATKAGHALEETSKLNNHEPPTTNSLPYLGHCGGFDDGASSPVIFFCTKLEEPLISSPNPRTVLQPERIRDRPKKSTTAKKGNDFISLAKKFSAYQKKFKQFLLYELAHELTHN